jgi:hypothetical protein
VGRPSLLAPSSPTRIDGGSYPVWNVTGRGGGRADYRRRTVEYVDNSANNPAHHSHIPVDFNKHGNFILPYYVRNRDVQDYRYQTVFSLETSVIYMVGTT